jgi:16S rRNA (guanine527-N7)-methyltransferase
VVWGKGNSRQRYAVHALNGNVGQIEEAFRDAGIAGLPREAFDQFHDYLQLLLRWNSRVSLTAVREPVQIIRRHFVECSWLAQHIPPDVRSVLDYGSGAGLPGIPVAICRPGIRVTLAEAQGKKAAFLREAVRVLGIDGEVFDGRVETMPRELQFDAVAMRAVDQMHLAIPVAVQRTRRYLVLLTTEGLAPVYGKLAPELEWMEPVSLPNTRQMILAIGQRL